MNPREQALAHWLRELERDRTLDDDAVDRAVDERLGLPPPDAGAPAPELLGAHRTGVRALARVLAAARVAPTDVFVDVGAGDGRATLVARLLTGADCRGIEVQRSLVERARATARHLGIEAAFEVGDAREAVPPEGTVFYMYSPSTGGALNRTLGALRAVAATHAIRVCTQAVTLPASCDWLVEIPGAFDEGELFANLYRAR